MTQEASCVEILKPRMDDRPIWDIILAPYRYHATLLAHDLKLFSLLAEPRTLTEVCDALDIELPPAQMLLTVLASIDLVELKEGYYSLTPLATDYLLESSPTYFGGFMNMMIAMDEILTSFKNIKNVVLNHSHHFQDKHDRYKSYGGDFARARHTYNMSAALNWPEKIDLSNYSKMLDIGGGSGAHSINAAFKWPSLQAVVFDHPTACEVAQEFISLYRLQNRIKTLAGDVWKDSFPEADIHFHSEYYHEELPEGGRFLTQKSFDCLPSGGRLIIHEMLFNDTKIGPYSTAAVNMAQFLTIGGYHYSGCELSEMLSQVGFVDVEVFPTVGYWNIVTGCKP